jgi:uncharacterized protein (TIGR03067 family)
MLRVSALILAIGVMGAAPDAKSDKLEDTWAVKSFVHHGEKMPEAQASKMKLILKDGKFSLKEGDETIDEGTYAVDTSKSPAHIDIVSNVSDKQGVVDPGIFELKGDTLKTAFDEIGKRNRPTTFDAQKYQVVEFTRVKK